MNRELMRELDAHFRARYADSVRFARRFTKTREDAEDAVQEAALKVLRTTSEFRGDAKFQSWFFRVVVNAAFEHRRRIYGLTRLHREFVEVPVEYRDPKPAPDVQAMRACARERIAYLMQNLSDAEKPIFAAWFVKGMTAAEIARQLGITRANAKSHLHRSREYLVAEFTGEAPATGRAAACILKKKRQLKISKITT